MATGPVRDSGTKLAKLAALDTTIASLDPEVQRLKRAEIAARYKRKRKRNHNREPYVFSNERVKELNRLAQYLYDGGKLPNNKEGMTFALILASHLRDPASIRQWLAEVAPWYDDEEVEKLLKRVTVKQYRWRGATIAKLLNVTWAVHEALSLETIGAVDKPQAVIAAERMAALARKRERDRRWRQRKRRGKPRAQYEAESLSQTRPWEAFGIKRRQWERRGKPLPPKADDASVSSLILPRNKDDTPASRRASRAAQAVPVLPAAPSKPRRRTLQDGVALPALAPPQSLRELVGPSVNLDLLLAAVDAGRHLATAATAAPRQTHDDGRFQQ